MSFFGNFLKDLKKGITSTGNGTSTENSQGAITRDYLGPINLKQVNVKENEIYNDGIYDSREANTVMSTLDVPSWGYKDFINERVNFQKGLDSMMGEPSWLYFKIFFKFNTNYGLLGGIMNNNGKRYAAENTALQYLWRNMYAGNAGFNHTNEAMDSRVTALVKFVRTLSFISSHAPWFFSSVKDVNAGLTMNLENLIATKEIEIECMEDAVDMRLMTLMDYYKLAAYDNINQKEILPENLRQFDMDIVVFQSPIRYLHTSSRDLKGRSTIYKNLNATNMTDRMSFKLFSFEGCEFDYNSLNNMLPQTFTSDKPFNSKPTFKIKYVRCYQHTQNEFAKVLFGDTGFLWNTTSTKVGDNSKYEFQSTVNQKNINNKETLGATGSWTGIVGNSNQTDTQATRQTQMKYANDNKYYANTASQTYKTLVDVSESTISAAMMLIDGKAGLGNLYGDAAKWSSGLKSVVDNTKEAYKNTWKNGIKNFLQF